MPKFSYKAKDRGGRVRTGSLDVANKAAARQRLVRMHLKPLTITATDAGGASTGFLSGIIKRDKSGKLVIGIGGGPTAKDIIVFTKQFSTMLASGVPLVQALSILAGQQRCAAFGENIDSIKTSVENGSTLSDAMIAFPKLFDTLFTSMVRAGEASGNLDGILAKLVTYMEKSAKIKSQVKSAMVYPVIIMVVALSVVTALLTFVVPVFAAQFIEAGNKLPALTQFVVDSSDWLRKHIAAFMVVLVVGVVAHKKWVATDAGRAKWDAILLKMPLLGDLLKKVAVGRFCQTLSTMLMSGVNMLEALSICASAAGNVVVERFILNAKSKVEQGTKLSQPLGEGGFFPNMVVSMVAVGETTGAMDEMLIKVAEFYEEEVDVAVKTMMSMIEPILIVGIGGVVGVIVIAMYLPIFEMASNVG